MKKCTDRKGVTILMALLLLLVASMVSVVILTAATTAARHISNDRQSQQAYLTVSSAAELLRDDILSSGYEQKVTRRPTATGSYIERTEVTQTPQGAMKVWLERGIEAVGRGIAYTDVITLTPDAASGLDAVQADPHLRHHRDPFSGGQQSGQLPYDPHPQRRAEAAGHHRHRRQHRDGTDHRYHHHHLLGHTAH